MSDRSDKVAREVTCTGLFELICLLYRVEEARKGVKVVTFAVTKMVGLVEMFVWSMSNVFISVLRSSSVCNGMGYIKYGKKTEK